MCGVQVGRSLKFKLLRFGFCNVNCLTNKLGYVSSFVKLRNINVFGVVETWLTSTTPDSFVSINGYQIVRVDTEGTVPKHGVCFYIQDSISFQTVQCDCHNVVIIHLILFSVFLVLVYRPPSASLQDNVKLVHFLSEFCKDKEVVIMGDFNLPEVNWLVHNAMSLHYPPLTQMFMDTFNILGLTQWVKDSTFYPSGNIIDLVFTTEYDRMGDLQLFPPFPNCGHCGVIFDYNFELQAEPVTMEMKKKAWFKGKYKMIDYHLQSLDWKYELQNRSANEMFIRLVEILTPLVDRYIPTSVSYCGSSFPSQPPATLRRARARAWKRYKDLRSTHGRRAETTQEALTNYNDLNTQYRLFFINSQINYEMSLVNSIKESPKAFHSYIRGKKVGSPTIGPLKQTDGTVTSNCAVMSELLADEFFSFYVSTDPVSPAPHQSFSGSFTDVPLSLSDVVQRFTEMEVDSSMGPDNIHPMLLHSCPTLAEPFFILFKQSLSEGAIPAVWKNSSIVPIFKKGSRYTPINYRPISLTSVCCKTLERIICEHLYKYLESNHLLSPHQFGFRRGRTVDDQLLLTYNSVTSWLDSTKVVDVVLFDFAKAFDTVCHSVLITKLRLLGVGGKVLCWIRDFLTERSMWVTVGGHRSTARSVLSGVPQGSVLGPLLFLIYINNLPVSITNNCKLFADDLKIYLKVASNTSLSLARDLSSCQRDIDQICEVAASWGLKLNAEKCVVLRFQRGEVSWDGVIPLSRYNINGEHINIVSSHKDLGVTVDNTLRFHVHIRQIVNKAAGLSSNILKTTLCRSEHFMKTLLISHIRPLLEYASPVWNTGYLGDLRLLESVQRRWTKMIDGLGDVPYSHRLAVLDLYSVKGRLLRADMLKCWKIFHGKCGLRPEDIFAVAPPIGTRGHRYKTTYSVCSTESRRRFFSHRCVGVWNSLPDDVVALESLQSFKSALHRTLGPLLYEYVD